MATSPDFAAPCGLYCGVCAILIAHKENNQKFKGRLVALYQGATNDKGILPNSQGLTTEDIHCGGCLSDDLFMHCKQCAIRDCVQERGYEGCHQCSEFPCEHIEDFPMVVGKKVILRAIPYWREVGTEKWMADEQARYVCPECGHKLFRGAMRCNSCKASVDLD